MGKTWVNILKVLCFSSTPASSTPYSITYPCTQIKLLSIRLQSLHSDVPFYKVFFAWVSTKSICAENLRLIMCGILGETHRQDKVRSSLLTSQFSRKYGVTIPTSTKLPEVYVWVKFVGCLAIVFVKRFTKLFTTCKQLTKTLSSRKRKVNSWKWKFLFPLGSTAPAGQALLNVVPGSHSDDHSL